MILTHMLFFFPDIGGTPVVGGFDGILPVGFFSNMLTWSDSATPPVGDGVSMYPLARIRRGR